MKSRSAAFLPTFLAVVLATLLPVISVAFVSIPFSIGGHPGEPIAATSRPAFHPS
jgi:hypothetical protein